MKSTKLMCITAVTSGLATQSKPDHKSNKHHHYKLIDMGTFGGPLSGVNEPLNYVPTVNGRGDTVASRAATTAW